MLWDEVLLTESWQLRHTTSTGDEDCTSLIAVSCLVQAEPHPQSSINIHTIVLYIHYLSRLQKPVHILDPCRTFLSAYRLQTSSVHDGRPNGVLVRRPQHTPR